jgi:hypothetical protein
MHLRRSGLDYVMGDIQKIVIHTNSVTIRPSDKMWMTSEIRKEIRIRDHLRKKYIKNKIGTNER